MFALFNRSARLEGRQSRLSAGAILKEFSRGHIGTPTFIAYQHHNEEALLYFDNLIDKDLLSVTEKFWTEYTAHTLE